MYMMLYVEVRSYTVYVPSSYLIFVLSKMKQ